VLLWRVLQRLGISGAWLAAAIFAVHPVEVESVAWISERKNVLSGAFYFLAMLAYFRFRPLTGAGKTDPPDWRFYPLVIVLFLCALLSKTVTCSLPAVLVLLTWWKNGRVVRRDAWALTPLFILGAGLGLATAWLEKHHAGAAGADWSLSVVQRCLLAGRTLWFYVGKLIWPHQFSFMYPRWEIDPGMWWQYLFSFAAVVVLVALWVLRQRIGKGPLVAALVFAGTLVPALGFFDLFPFRYSYVADHFQYLAGVALIVLAATAGAKICERTERLGHQIGAAVGATALMMLGLLTLEQACSFKNGETLWRHALASCPNSWGPHFFWGTMLQESGRLSEAVDQFDQAVQLNPDAYDARNHLGDALLRAGRTEDAILQYVQTLRIKPDNAKAHDNLGTALLFQGNVQDAISHYEQALRIKPDLASAHYNLGYALVQAGRVQDGIGHYEQALQLNPDYVEAHYNLGIALEQTGNVPEAIRHYEQALRIKSNFTEAKASLARLQAGQ
jgi:tetratricopeptide (TPR) repeat protein